MSNTPGYLRCSNCGAEFSQHNDHTVLDIRTWRDGKSISATRVYCWREKCEKPILNAVHGDAGFFG